MGNVTDEEFLVMMARVTANGAMVPPEAQRTVKPDSNPEMLEAEIQAECVQLMIEDGWRPLRTDPVSDKSRGKGFGEVGMADYQFSRSAAGETGRRGAWCQLLYVEFKSRCGKPSTAQFVWHRNERASGFLTWIAGVDFPSSVDGFKAHYRNSGLMRRKDWGR